MGDGMTVQTREHIFAILRDHHADLHRLGVQRYGLFGSFVRNTPTDVSDVDVLVEFAPGQKTFDHFMSLAFFLEDVLGRPVDLVTPESLSPHIGPHILREVEYATVGA
jgi:predicted nucleotidyltransferase